MTNVIVSINSLKLVKIFSNLKRNMMATFYKNESQLIHQYRLGGTQVLLTTQLRHAIRMTNIGLKEPLVLGLRTIYCF